MKQYVVPGARGFTLIELLIVIAILGILYSLAMPSYTQYVLESRRADVQQIMLQHAAVLERQYTRMGGYPATFTFGDSSYYNFTYRSDATSGQSNGSEYTLKAVPKGAQSGDSCGTLQIDQTGNKTAATSGCWGS